MMLQIKDATGKANCKGCDSLIAKGDKEVVGNLGSGLYPRHYHINCFKEEYWGFIIDLMHTMTDAELEDISSALDEVRCF